MNRLIYPIAALAMLSGCSAQEPSEADTGQSKDLIATEYPEKVGEIQAVLDDIELAIREGDIDRLIAHHAYSPKFSDFQEGGRRTGASENEANERAFFGNATSVNRFEYDDPKVSVYGDVAVATVHPDVELVFGEDVVTANRQLTLVFVDTAEGWKIVHEHNSPLETDQGD
ncbi:nuclear transport factor 2 family protein [Blastomonas marina]|nr:nuclear transport factor 2 family protein [Blastomonas marina]